MAELGYLVTGVPIVLIIGRDIGSVKDSTAFDLSFETSLENDDLRNFGRQFGDLETIDISDVSKLFNAFLLVPQLAFIKFSSVASSTDETEDDKSPWIRHGISDSQFFSLCVGTEKL
jgi:hypothetical protein